MVKYTNIFVPSGHLGKVLILLEHTHHMESPFKINQICSVLCLLCLCARLFNCALWSPAGKGLTSWLSFVMSYCEFVTFPLVSWVGVVLDCIDS